MYTLISGSPKIHSSNSLYFLKKINEDLKEETIYELKNNEYSEILESITKSNVLILAFPLYVDSPTSITLKFLDYIVDNKIDLCKKQVYVIINCGFREGEQNKTAIGIIKRWCDKVNAKYSGSLLIGAGEIVGKEYYKFISRSALKKLKEFKQIIINRDITKDIITTMDLFNNKMYCYFANYSWNKKCKKYNLSKEDIIRK